MLLESGLLPRSLAASHVSPETLLSQSNMLSSSSDMDGASLWLAGEGERELSLQVTSLMMQRQHTGFQAGILAFPIKICVMLSKLLNFSEPSTFQVKKRLPTEDKVMPN